MNEDLNASLAQADELSREFNSLLQEVSPSTQSVSQTPSGPVIPRERPQPSTSERQTGGSSSTLPYSTSSSTLPYSTSSSSLPYSTSSSSLPYTPSSSSLPYTPSSSSSSLPYSPSTTLPYSTSSSSLPYSPSTTLPYSPSSSSLPYSPSTTRPYSPSSSSLPYSPSTTLPYSPSSSSLPYSPNTTLPYSTSSNLDSIISSSKARPSSPVFSPHQLTPSQAQRDRYSLPPSHRSGGFDPNYSYDQLTPPNQSPRTQRRASPSPSRQMTYDRSPQGSISYIDSSPSPPSHAPGYDQSHRGRVQPSQPLSNLLSPYDSATMGQTSPRLGRSRSPRQFSQPAASSTLPRNFVPFSPSGE
ncbi:unnamed protein product [Coregonus sp. 'balchen']|nr:unnamed protein product [Coregonus sp. 'balchen']